MANYYDDNFGYIGEMPNNHNTEIVAAKTLTPSAQFFCDEYSLEKPLNNEWSLSNLIEYLKNQLNLNEKMEIDEGVSKATNLMECDNVLLRTNKPLNENDYYDGYFTLTLKKEILKLTQEKPTG